MKALITGAGGFCGRHLVSYLRSQDVSVHSMGISVIQQENHHHITDVTNSSSLIRVLEDVKPDYVFHLAGVTVSPDPTLFYRVNTQFAVSLLDALTKYGSDPCPLLFVGTSAEYGMISPDHLPIRESLPPHPYNHYGISKLAQTFAASAATHLPVIMVRPFNIIGPGMPEHLVVQSFIRQITSTGDPEKLVRIEVGNLESSRDFIDIADVVRIYWRLINNPNSYGEIINVCSGRATVVSDLLSKLIELSGITVQVVQDRSRFKQVDVPAHYGSTEKLERLVGGIAFTDLETTLKRLLVPTGIQS
jgi:GDP-4-dehydro-6-deoxy-D-mannose reductase